MRHLLLIALAASVTMPCVAQPGEEKAVLAVIDRFFAAMSARDTAAMAQVITRDGVLYASQPGSGKPAHAMSHAGYLVNLAKGTGRLLERIWDPIVRVDETIASVTAPYDFHVDGSFSHCGTDVFTLVKGPNGWVIAGGAYTMRKDGCMPSPLGAIKQ